ncbi:hypothetical protein KUV85_04385 [Nocardioides panacisoli]|uniref:homing endonuclease associated repeat-containing protein n=1 Tax=Nocardioides panacisoli TaxID=627624 RepID=UPI001C635F3F|nr:hypothetical protein [Nocardioides panacisoli]QYJ04932.1 hypothetical protein KUV85_04385 [Nocardioides panacisoli]
MAHQQYDDTALLDALRRAAAEAGDPLPVAAYDRVQRTHGLPSSARIVQRFGAWRTACQRAGLSAHAAPGGTGKKWTAERVTASVREFLADPEAGTSFAAYQAWAKGRADAPSGQTVRNAHGSWSAATTAARDAAGHG